MAIVTGAATDFTPDADCRCLAPSVTESGDFAVLAFTLESLAGDGAITLPAVSGYIARVSVQLYSNYDDEFTTEYDNAAAFTASLSDENGSAYPYSIAAAGDPNILGNDAVGLFDPWLGDIVFTLTSSITAGSRVRVAIVVTSSPPLAQRLATTSGSVEDIIAEEGKIRVLEGVVTNAGHLTTLAFTAEDIGGADGTITLPEIVGHITRLACVRHSDYSDEWTTDYDSAVDIDLEISDGHGNTYAYADVAKEGEANALGAGGIADPWFGPAYLKLTDITAGARVRFVVYISQASAIATWSKGLYIESPTTSEEIPFMHIERAVTITRLYGETNTGTVSLKAEWRAEGDAFASGTSIHATPLVADDDGQEQTAGWADATIPAGSFLYLVTSAISGSPAKLMILVEMANT